MENYFKGGFTIEKGIHAQQEQLDRWRSIMKPTIFEQLKTHCEKLNNELKAGTQKNAFGKLMPQDGYSVFRGTTMDNWIHNNLMRAKIT
jgi:hypothetical protein